MIKYITIALFVAAVSAAPHRNVDFVCPEDDIADTSCLGPKDCMYPNPENCNQFIHCEVKADNKTGNPVVKDCPAGLEWNDNKKECDWPWASTCNKATGEPSTAEPSTAQPSTAPPATEAPSSSAEPSTAQPSTGAPSTAQPSTGAPSSAEPSTAEPSTEAPTTEEPVASSTSGSGSGNIAPCSEAEIAATGCKGPKDCLYPNPENCNSFIQCTVNSDNKTGTPVVMPCPSDLEWNDNEKICDYPASSTCNKGSTAGSPTTSEASTAEPSTASPETDAPSSSAEPSTAQPSTGAPSTAEPSTAQPSTAQPSTAQPSTAQPSTAQPSTGAPSTQEPVASSTSGSGSGNKPPCSEEEIAATGCKGPKDCLYPNPENCNSFIQCTVNADNKTGTPVVMPCPSGLEWNDNDKICDWPSSSTCNKVSTPGSTTSTSTTPAAPEETTPEQTTTNSPSTPADSTTTEGSSSEITTAGAESTTEAEQTTTQQSETSTLPACRPEDDDDDSDLDLNKICEGCSDPRTVAHPSNNGKYIICSGKDRSVRKCAPGLLYSKDQLSCTYAGLVDSNGPSSTQSSR